MHDTAVGLVVSDGPKSDYGTDPSTESGQQQHARADREAVLPTATQYRRARRSTARTPDVNPNPPDDPANSESHEFRRVIQVHKDGMGKRKVRIEFVDANGLSITPGRG